MSKETEDDFIGTIEQAAESANSLVVLRIQMLTGSASPSNGPGIPSLFSAVLRDSVGAWMESLQKRSDNNSQIPPFSNLEEAKTLLRILTIYQKMAGLDATLNEELGHEGTHAQLSKLIQLDTSSSLVMMMNEQDQDVVMEIQEIACEIAATSKSFPLRESPLSFEELSVRLPLSFEILPDAGFECGEDGHGSVENYNRGVRILINQVTERQSAQNDVGYVLWPSSIVLSRWLMSNIEQVRDKEILELGAGCGLVGLVAARIQELCGKNAKTKHGFAVILTDFNPMVVKNARQNIILNELEGIAAAEELDFYHQDVALEGWLDSNGNTRNQVDLILAADVICQTEDAFAAARAIYSALRFGGKAIVVSADSKHRFGVEKLEEACTELGMKISKTNVKDFYEGVGSTLPSDYSDNMKKTAGYVDGMTLTLYIVNKCKSE